MSIATNQGKRRASARKYANRRTERAKVIRRFEANGGRCEACRCTPDRVEVDHLYSRGHLIADKYSSLAELCVAVCPECHLLHTDWTDPDMVERLRWEGNARFAQRVRAVNQWQADSPAIGALRQMIELLEAGQ